MLNTPPLAGAALSRGQRLSREGPLLTQNSFNEFGTLLGTDAPIHVDPEYASKTPFGQTIAQGMLLLAPLETWLCELFGDSAWFGSGQLHVRLLNTAIAGERATMHMTVADRTPLGATTLEFTLTCGERTLAAGRASIHG